MIKYFLDLLSTKWSGYRGRDVHERKTDEKVQTIDGFSRKNPSKRAFKIDEFPKGVSRKERQMKKFKQ